MRHRQILMSLERLYSTVLEVEQLRRTQPNVQLSGFDMEEANSQLEEWLVDSCKSVAAKKSFLMYLNILGRLSTKVKRRRFGSSLESWIPLV
jgi:hypothetical protein